VLLYSTLDKICKHNEMEHIEVKVRKEKRLI